MTTNQYAPSWRWDDDGDTITGQITSMRKVESKFKPGTLVTVMDVRLESGDVRAVWCSNVGLARFVEVSMPAVGDNILIKRAGKKEFQTKAGETRSMWEWETEILAQPRSDLPVSEPVPVRDEDIPF